MKTHAIFFICWLPLTSAMAGEVYRWQEKNGVVGYSDKSPTGSMAALKKYKVTNSGLRLEKPVANPSDMPLVTDKPVEKSEPAVVKSEVVLYSFDECGGVCKQAEQFLDNRGVLYTRKGDNAAKGELLKLTGKLEAPVLVIAGGTTLSGFEESIWGKALDEAGYARKASKP